VLGREVVGRGVEVPGEIGVTVDVEVDRLGVQLWRIMSSVIRRRSGVLASCFRGWTRGKGVRPLVSRIEERRRAGVRAVRKGALGSRQHGGLRGRHSGRSVRSRVVDLGPRRSDLVLLSERRTSLSNGLAEWEPLELIPASRVDVATSAIGGHNSKAVA
jgi:hypothetical protein